MTIAEAAALLGLHPSTIRHQIAAGVIAATKHGRDHWITPAAVDDYRRNHLKAARPASTSAHAESQRRYEEAHREELAARRKARRAAAKVRSAEG